MSKPPWHAWLAQTLSRLQPADRPVRVAVMGMGNSLRGDDGTGVAVARLLRLKPEIGQRLLVVDAGLAPENQLGPLLRYRPDLVLLVDSAQLGAEPGTVRWLDWREARGLSASTHTMPPSVLAHFLTKSLPCEVALVCIQPASDTLGEALSPPVREAVLGVARVLAEATRSIGDTR